MRFYWFWLAAAIGSHVLAQDPGTTAFPRALSSFTCHGRLPGYYADLETGCRTYHVCDGNSQFTYVCPKRTLFQQSDRICDHAYRVRCQDSEHFYEDEEEQEEQEEYGDEGGSGGVPAPEGSTPSSKGDYEDEYDQFIPTESTPIEIDDISTTLLTTPRSKIYTTPVTPATATRVITAGPSTTRIITAATPTRLIAAGTPRVISVATATATGPITAGTPKITAATAKTQRRNTDSTIVNPREENAVQKFLKFRLKDFRSLFFIPEFENNSIVAKPERELILPLEKGDFLTFKNRREGRRSSFPSCPAYCNPKFFLPGTCHPCIMIK